jgi:hypothetical protein
MLYMVGVTLLATLMAAAVRMAFRDEYIVVLHWDRVGYFVLERSDGTRYQTIGPLRVPWAVARYAPQAMSFAMANAHARLRDWAAAHKVGVLGAKV